MSGQEISIRDIPYRGASPYSRRETRRTARHEHPYAGGERGLSQSDFAVSKPTYEENNDLPSFVEAERIRVQLLASRVIDVLPDLEDRLLICDAVVHRCDCFCTRDWGTILKHRHALRELPIQIITPTEWWALIEPYAPLWV